jgi:hypothetical protein
MTGLGAIQDASFWDGKLYLFGDAWSGTPRGGVIREYTSNYKPTGGDPTSDYEVVSPMVKVKGTS